MSAFSGSTSRQRWSHKPSGGSARAWPSATREGCPSRIPPSTRRTRSGCCTWSEASLSSWRRSPGSFALAGGTWWSRRPAGGQGKTPSSQKAPPSRVCSPAVSVAIIGGTGDEGFGLAVRLGRAGASIVIGSRAEEKGKASAEKARVIAGADAPIDGTTNQEAAAGSDIVLVTVPFAGQAEIYRAIKDSVRPGAIVCDATSPLASAVGRPALQVLTPSS